jgi:hypothetical protein
LFEGRLPESWVAPEHVRQWRSRARLRKTLMGGRTAWQQRIRAVLYHHGVSGAPEHLRTLAGHEFLAKLKLPVDATERIDVALEMIDTLEIQLAAIESELRKLARRPDVNLSVRYGSYATQTAALYPAWSYLALLKVLGFHYSHWRGEYVLRVIGDRFGPVYRTHDAYPGW